MSIIDNAIARLAFHALATKYDSTNTIKAAPVYPPESVGLSSPFAVTYLNGGRMVLQSADTWRFFPTIAVDFHFDISRFKTTYAQINTVIPDFSARLAGDPTLNGSVSTITGEVTIDPPTGFDWNGDGRPETMMVRFSVPVKSLETPTT